MISGVFRVRSIVGCYTYRVGITAHEIKDALENLVHFFFFLNTR